MEELINNAVSDIIEVIPISEEYIELKKLSDNIKSIIEFYISYFSEQYWYLDALYKTNNEVLDYYQERLLNITNDLYNVIIEDDTNKYYQFIESMIYNILETFFNKIQPILKELDIEKRKEATSKYLVTNIVNLLSEY